MSHPTFAELFRQLNELDESPRIEAKRGSDVGHSILETISAFSNEPGLGGGYLLLGVEEDSGALPGLGSYRVCGVPNPDRLQQNLLSSCQGQFSDRLRPDIRVESYEGLAVVVVFVPEVPSTSKPVYIKRDGLPQGAKRRIGSSDVSCTGDDLAILFGGRGFKPYDAEIIRDASLSDLDVDAIDTYRRLRRGLKKDASELDYSDAELLRALGCVDEYEGRSRPTIAGMVLFGSRLGLRRLMPLHRIEYIVVPGREWGEGLDESLTATEFRESLITLLPRLERLVSGDLPRTTFLPTEGVAARSTPVLPERVLREAIVNAAMHRDYRPSSPIQIIRFANRLEVRNPGYSLKAVETLEQPGSVPRNPTIAEVLHELDYAETKGSGVRRITTLMEKANLSKPLFVSERSEERFSATLFTHNLMSEEDLDWLSDFVDCNLSGEDIKALALIREVGYLSNQTLRSATGLDTLTASRRLKRLRELRLISVDGKGSATVYGPGPLLVERAKGSLQAYSLSALRNELDGKATTLRDRAVSQEPPPKTLDERIRSLGKRTTDRSELESLIFDLVSWRPMSSDEIAGRLSRRKNKLVTSYLSPMVRQGLLRTSNPEPTHPYQTYMPGVRRLGSEDDGLLPDDS